MNEIEEKNAIITGKRIDIERGLSAWLTLDYGGAGQGFGGYLLYAPVGWAAHQEKTNYCGHFIYRVITVAGVEEWEQLVGKTVRVRANHMGIEAIGHIVKDDWFNPKAEFKAMREKEAQE